ncbi:MAG: metallophosphoesterase [Ignavibacteriaceae bacterium]|nr:metallophosphoesterase [Ignavibacteriaceae bacterium]
MLIAHISDLHLNSFYNDSIFKRVNYLLKQISENKVDHLIITGDITDNASEKDFEIFRRMLTKYGFMKGEKLSLIPGNHDIFGGVQKAEDIFTFPEKCNTVNYNKRVNNFLSYFPEAFSNCQYLSSKRFFPFTKKINNTLIVGLNSIAQYSKLSNPFGSNGEIDATQFGELFDILKTTEKDVKHKIILIHHHFNKLKSEAKSTFGSIWSGIEKQTMKLKGKRRLFNLFREFKVDIVLHGHIHESKEYFRKDVRFLNAGATIRSNNQSMKINYLTISKGKIEVEIQSIDFPDKLKNESESIYKKDNLKLVNAALVT